MIIKGFIIGIGKILPGVSGAMLAISLGIYEKCIYILSNLREELLKNIKFIMFLSIGFLLAIILGSRLVSFFINNYYIYTMYMFIGLIIGTIPDILKETKFSKKNLLFLVIGFILLFSINFINISIKIESYFLLGIIESISILIPGVSGTAIMMLLGNYNLMLELLMNPFQISFIPFLLGLIIGILLISRFINHFIHRYKDQSYYLITGFLISSLLSLYISIMHTRISIIDGMAIILLLILGIFISKKINKKD